MLSRKRNRVPASRRSDVQTAVVCKRHNRLKRFGRSRKEPFAQGRGYSLIETEREVGAFGKQPGLHAKAVITIKRTIEVLSGGKWWLIEINRRKYTLSHLDSQTSDFLPGNANIGRGILRKNYLF
jgi:hypothetical protein